MSSQLGVYSSLYTLGFESKVSLRPLKSKLAVHPQKLTASSNAVVLGCSVGCQARLLNVQNAFIPLVMMYYSHGIAVILMGEKCMLVHIITVVMTPECSAWFCAELLLRLLVSANLCTDMSYVCMQLVRDHSQRVLSYLVTT